ncbi:hypothetical protein PUG81_02685 [Erwiniaceae bacterium L1_54_6]|nr:hypothetical protein [Erwiniaceae bacterium L1_54_6]
MTLNATTSNRTTNTAHYTEETSGVTRPQLSDISDLPLTDADLRLVGEYVKKLDDDTWGRDVRELVLAMVKKDGVDILNQKDQNGHLCFPDLGMEGLNLKKIDSAALQNIADKGDFIRLIIAAGKGLSIKHPDQRERVPPEEVNVFVRAVGSWLETKGATQHYATHLRASYTVLAQQMKKENWDTHCYSQVTEIMAFIARPPFISDRELQAGFGNANLHSYQPTQERDAFLKAVFHLLPNYRKGISDAAAQRLFEADKTSLIARRLQPLEGEAWTGSRCKKVLKIVAALKGPLPQGVSQEHTIDASNLDAKINNAMNAKGEIDRTEFLKLVMAAYRGTSPGSAGLSRQDADAFLDEIKQGLIGEVNSMTWSVSCCRDFLRLRGMDGTAEQRWEKNVSDRMRSGLDELLSEENAHDGSSQVKRDAFMKLLCEVFAPKTADNIGEVVQVLREIVSQLPQKMETWQDYQAIRQGHTGSLAPAFPDSLLPTMNPKALSKMNPLQAAVWSLAFTSEVEKIAPPEQPHPTRLSPKQKKGMQDQPLPVCRPEDKPKPAETAETAETHSALSGVATGVITALLTGNPLLALGAGLVATFSGVEGRSTGTTTTRATVSKQQDPVAALPPKVRHQAARFISRAQTAALSDEPKILSEIKAKTRDQHMADFAAAYAYEKTAESNWATGTGDVLVSGPQTVVQRMREEDPALGTKTVDQIQQDSLYISQLAGEILHGDYKVPGREMAGNPRQAYDRELQRINDQSATPASQTASTAATTATKTSQTLTPTIALSANHYLSSTLQRLAAEAHPGATPLAKALLDTRLRQPYMDAFTTEFNAGTELDRMRQRYPAFKGKSDQTIQKDPVYIQHLMDKVLNTTTTTPAYRTSDVRTLVAPEMALVHNQLSVINRLRGEEDNTATAVTSQATLEKLNELALTLNSVLSLPVVNDPEKVEVTTQVRSLQQLQSDVSLRIFKTEQAIYDHEARVTDAFLSLEPDEFLGDLIDRCGDGIQKTKVTISFINNDGKKQGVSGTLGDLFEFAILPESKVTYPAGFNPGIKSEIERYRAGTAEQTAAEQAKLARKAELSLIKLDRNIKEGWPVDTNANARIDVFIQREINRLVPPGPDGKPVYTPETLIPVKRTPASTSTAATSTFNVIKHPIYETHSIKSLLCGTVERMHFEDLKDVLPPDALRPLFAPPRTATWSSGRYPYHASKRVMNNLESDRLTMMAAHRKTARREVTQGVILQSLSLLASNTGAPEHVQQAAQKLLKGEINPSTMKFGDYEIEGVFALPLNRSGAEKEYLLVKPFDTLTDSDSFKSMIFRPDALNNLKYAQTTWEFLESSLPAEALLKAESDPDLKRAFWLSRNFRGGSHWPSVSEAGGKIARKYTQPATDQRFFTKHEPYAFNEIAKGSEVNSVGKLADKLATIEEDGWITRDDLLLLSEEDYNKKRYIGWAKDAVQFFSLLSMLIPSVPLEIAVSLGLTALEYGLDYAEAELEYNPVEREHKHSQAKFLGLMSLYLEMPGAAVSSAGALRHAERSQHQALKQLQLRPKKPTINTKIKSAPGSASDAIAQTRFPFGIGRKDLRPGRISGQGTSLNPSGPNIELSHPTKTFSILKNTSEKSDTLIFDAHGIAIGDPSEFRKFILKLQDKKPSPHEIPLPDNHILSFDAPHGFTNMAEGLPKAVWAFQANSPFVTISKKEGMVFNPFHNFPLTANDVWKFFPNKPQLNKQLTNSVGISGRMRKHLQVAPGNENYLGRGTDTPGAIRNYEHEKMVYSLGTGKNGKPVYMTEKQHMAAYAQGMVDNHNLRERKLNNNGKKYLISPDLMLVREGKVTTTEKVLGTIQSNPEFAQYKHIVIVSCRVEPGGHWTEYWHTSIRGPKGAGHLPGLVYWRSKPQYQVTEATYTRDINGKLRLTKLRVFPRDMPEEEKKATEKKVTEATRFTGVSFKRDGLSITVNQTTTMESLAEQYKQAYNLKEEMDEIKEEFIAQNPELPESGTIAPGTVLNPPAIQLPAAGQPYVTRGDESFNDIKVAIEKQYGPESAALFSVLNSDLAQDSNTNKILPVDKSFDLADVQAAALHFKRSAEKITVTLDSTMENIANDLIQEYDLREQVVNFVAELRSKNPGLPATGNIKSGTVIYLPDIKFPSSGDIYETRGYESFGDFLYAIESRDGFDQAMKCYHLNSNHADINDRNKVLPAGTQLKMNGEIYSNNDGKITLSVPVPLSILAKEFKHDYRYEDKSADDISDDFRRSNPDITISNTIPRGTILNRPDIGLSLTEKVYKTRGYESFNDLYTGIANTLGTNSAREFLRRYNDYTHTDRRNAILPAGTTFYLTETSDFYNSFRLESGKAILIRDITVDTLASEFKSKFNLDDDIAQIKADFSSKNPHFPKTGNIPTGTIVHLPAIKLPATGSVYKARGYESFNDVMVAGFNKHGSQWQADFLNRYNDFDQPDRRFAILPSGKIFHLSETPASSMSFRREANDIIVTWDLSFDSLAREFKEKYRIRDDIREIKTELRTKNPGLAASGMMAPGTVVHLPDIQLPAEKGMYKARGYESFSDVLNAGIAMYGAQWADKFLLRYGELAEKTRRDEILSSDTTLNLSELNLPE